MKHDLEALDKVLATYSDEKVKEIRLQEKQGGDISLEEVERSLRENGLIRIADDLKENFEKSNKVNYNIGYTLKPMDIRHFIIP